MSESAGLRLYSVQSSSAAGPHTLASGPGTGDAELGMHEIAVDQHRLVIEEHAAVPHRDIDMHRCVVRPAELLVGAHGEHDVAVERSRLLAVSAHAVGLVAPAGILIAAPAN